MYLANLRLYDFRNFPELDVILKNGINVFFGDNAQGKNQYFGGHLFSGNIKACQGI